MKNIIPIILSVNMIPFSDNESGIQDNVFLHPNDQYNVLLHFQEGNRIDLNPQSKILYDPDMYVRNLSNANKFYAFED